MNDIEVSVRDLTGFVLRHGDIDSGRGRARDPDAMKEGIRLHQKYQKSQKGAYMSEVPYTCTLPFSEYMDVGEDFYRPVHLTDDTFEPVIKIKVLGRADGVTELGEIEEIKCMLSDVKRLAEPELLHLAQAKCYAAIHGRENEMENVTVRMIYISIDTEQMKTFEYTYKTEELFDWFVGVVSEYCKWMLFLAHHREKRNESIKILEFPFEYRQGQKKLVADCYRTILREKKLFLMAPTGTGKTISTLFPAVKALGEGLSEKIFYLTAKTITRTVAEDTMGIFAKNGTDIISLTITARDKICIFEHADCNPAVCKRAKGHFDRINEALFDMIRHEKKIDRACIEKYAEKYEVCPFEFGLDASVWADSVICDYNYAFDPNVYLRRFFDETKHDYIFLIDEAHNLVERAREMYSASISKENIIAVKKLVSVKKEERKVEKLHFNGLRAKLSGKLKRLSVEIEKALEEVKDIERLETLPDSLIFSCESAMTVYEKIFSEATRDFNQSSFHEEALNLYFSLRDFANAADVYDDHYITIGKRSEEGGRSIKLSCIDPSRNLSARYENIRSVIFFSATLLPVKYYEEQLGGNEDDYAVYAPSPFDPAKRFIGVAADISTRYKERNENSYRRVARYIAETAGAKKGNYMAFFPSYGYMEAVEPYLFEYCKEMTLLPQDRSMTEEEREKFLDTFSKNNEKTLIGLCVMGGVFSEGIDLTGKRLIGAVIAGAGLPQVSKERELIREFFEDRKRGTGFLYAYLYQGMNKVMQSAGRVIRTVSDTGVILLLDDRFLTRQYNELFPREWIPYRKVEIEEISKELDAFWKKTKGT